MNDKVIKTIDNLRINGYEVDYFENCEEAKKALLNEITKDKSVGIGGSQTIYDIGIHEDLINRGSEVYWHWLVDNERKDKERAEASNSSVYLSSSNALTQDGKIVNIDGLGNRVASIIYGHDKVYIVAGINKITLDVNEAIKRIKREACPKNAKRLNLDTSCRYTGECNDCSSNQRMCNVTVVLDKKPMQSEIKVILVNEELGY